MHVIGQIDRVRELGPHGWGRPWYLDQRRSAGGGHGSMLLTPTGDERWWSAPSGWWRWLANERGSFGSSQVPTINLGSHSSATGFTITNHALSSAYTYGSAGAGVAWRFVAPATGTLTDFYFRLPSYGGTAASVTSLDFELRNDSSDAPGTTLHASATIDPDSATGWVRVPSLSFEATAGTPYWFIIADADGNGTNFANVTRTSGGIFSSITDAWSVNAATTTDGFQAMTHANPGLCVVRIAGLSHGHPFWSTANMSNNVNRRGYRFASGLLSSDFRIRGLVTLQSAAAFSGLELYAGDAAPGTTPEHSGSFAIRVPIGTNPNGFAFDTAVTLTAGVAYRLVWTFGSNTTVPRRLQTEAGALDHVRQAMLGQGDLHTAIANGTTNWANDEVDSIPNAVILVADIAEGNGGDGDGGLRVHPGMSGGMRG